MSSLGATVGLTGLLMHRFPYRADAISVVFAEPFHPIAAATKGSSHD